MFYLVLFFIFFFAPLARADFNVVYDAATGDVLEFGLQDVSKLKSDSKYGLAVVKDTDPLFKTSISKLRYDEVTQKLILKTAPEITKINNDKARADIRAKVEGYLLRKQITLWLQAEGFDVTADLKTINDSITALKLEYAAIP